MATEYASIINGKYLEIIDTAQYTSSVVKTIIDKFTVANTDNSIQFFSVNIVNNGSTPNSSNLVIVNKAVQPKETYLCPELIGIVLDNGDFISTIASKINSLTVNVSGRIIS